MRNARSTRGAPAPVITNDGKTVTYTGINLQRELSYGSGWQRLSPSPPRTALLNVTDPSPPGWQGLLRLPAPRCSTQLTHHPPFPIHPPHRNQRRN